MSSQNYYIPHDPSFRTLVTCAPSHDSACLLNLSEDEFTALMNKYGMELPDEYQRDERC